MKRVVGFLLLAFVLAVAGLGLITSERLLITVHHYRPLVLSFGPAELLGHCRVRETSDPKSDVLANLIDLDADGTSEFRLAASVDGEILRCERRALLGFWVSVPEAVCHRVAYSCHP